MLIATASSSLTGILSLVLDLRYLVQIQTGVYSCASRETRIIIWVFCTIVFYSLVLYMTSMIYGFYASFEIENDPGQEEEISGADTVLQQIDICGNRIDVG